MLKTLYLFLKTNSLEFVPGAGSEARHVGCSDVRPVLSQSPVSKATARDTHDERHNSRFTAAAKVCVRGRSVADMSAGTAVVGQLHDGLK